MDLIALLCRLEGFPRDRAEAVAGAALATVEAQLLTADPVVETGDLVLRLREGVPELEAWEAAAVRDAGPLGPGGFPEAAARLGVSAADCTLVPALVREHLRHRLGDEIARRIEVSVPFLAGSPDPVDVGLVVTEDLVQREKVVEVLVAPREANPD